MSSERFAQYRKALQNLEDALRDPYSSAQAEAGTVKLFELSFELSWKVLKLHLEANLGVLTKSPREAINQAFVNDIITNEKVWLDMMQSRNRSSHVYEQEGMEALIEKIKTYLPELQSLLTKIGI